MLSAEIASIPGNPQSLHTEVRLALDSAGKDHRTTLLEGRFSVYGKISEQEDTPKPIYTVTLSALLYIIEQIAKGELDPEHLKITSLRQNLPNIQLLTDMNMVDSRRSKLSGLIRGLERRGLLEKPNVDQFKQMTEALFQMITQIPLTDLPAGRTTLQLSRIGANRYERLSPTYLFDGLELSPAHLAYLALHYAGYKPKEIKLILQTNHFPSQTMTHMFEKYVLMTDYPKSWENLDSSQAFRNKIEERWKPFLPDILQTQVPQLVVPWSAEEEAAYLSITPPWVNSLVKQGFEGNVFLEMHRRACIFDWQNPAPREPVKRNVYTWRDHAITLR